MNQNIKNAHTSVIDDITPNIFINLLRSFVSHFLGVFKNSSSTLSYGIPIWDISTMKSWINIWIGINGRNGRNILDNIILNTSPKSWDKASFMYLTILPYTFLPSIAPLYITSKFCSSKIISLDSLAISVASSTLIATSAECRAGASFTPSPI